VYLSCIFEFYHVLVILRQLNTFHISTFTSHSVLNTEWDVNVEMWNSSTDFFIFYMWFIRSLCEIIYRDVDDADDDADDDIGHHGSYAFYQNDLFATVAFFVQLLNSSCQNLEDSFGQSYGHDTHMFVDLYRDLKSYYKVCVVDAWFFCRFTLHTSTPQKLWSLRMSEKFCYIGIRFPKNDALNMLYHVLRPVHAWILWCQLQNH